MRFYEVEFERDGCSDVFFAPDRKSAKAATENATVVSCSLVEVPLNKANVAAILNQNRATRYVLREVSL